MKTIYNALYDFQMKVTPLTKDANNPFFKSSYASLEHIQSHIKPILAECGLIVIQRNVYDGQLFVETKVIHVESGEFESSLFPVVVQKSDAQSYGSAVSYAKRYSLSGLLNLIIQDSDDDGNGATKPNDKPKDTAKQETIWLTEEQFNKSIKADVKGINATLVMYSKAPYAIKKDWKIALESRLTELS